MVKKALPNYSYTFIGKSIRLSRILASDGKALILAMDHGFEHGPTDFIEGIKYY